MPETPNNSPAETPNNVPAEEHHHRSARQIFLRGLAITLPSILTIVIMLWIGRLIYEYLIYPVSTAVRYCVAEFIDDSQPRSRFVHYEYLPELDYVGSRYLLTPARRTRLETRRTEAIAAGQLRPGDTVPREWIAGGNARFAGVFYSFGENAVPYFDYAEVARSVPAARLPNSARQVYMELVTIRYFGSTFTLSTLAVLITILAIYFVGKLVRIRIGEYLVTKMETDVLGRLPIISNVYGSVKQVTDFVLSERKVEYNRVVALEYPRRGIWSVGFVTADGMRQTCDAAGEPLINILVPTSPMPVTGYTMSVPRRDVIDLDLSLDQAFQFVISCGVLVPPHQLRAPQRREFVKSAIEGKIAPIPKTTQIK